MTSEYFVITKEQALATEVALAERKIIGIPDKADCSVYISIPLPDAMLIVLPPAPQEGCCHRYPNI